MVRGEMVSCGASPARGCPGRRRVVTCDVEVRADMTVLYWVWQSEAGSGKHPHMKRGRGRSPGIPYPITNNAIIYLFEVSDQEKSNADRKLTYQSKQSMRMSVSVVDPKSKCIHDVKVQ
jgi:hypothetical protein